MAALAAQIIKLARSQVGYREGYSGGHWNNNQKYSDQVPGMDWSDYQAWCQTFQSWLAWKTDSPEPRTASCRVACDWFKQRGRFSEYPAVGAQVFFGSGGGSHVGRVYAYDADYAYTIEGNTNDSGSAEGNGVYLKRRPRRDSYLHGYGMPEFPEGVTTADPRLKGKSGYDYKTTADGPTGTAAMKEDSMPSAHDVAKAVAEYDGFHVPWPVDGKNAKWQLDNAVESVWRQTYRTDSATERIEAAVTALTAAVADLAAAQAATDAKVAALDLSGLVESLESYRLKFEVTAAQDTTE